eukprot:116680-Pyramimonas_sp.AAC.1
MHSKRVGKVSKRSLAFSARPPLFIVAPPLPPPSLVGLSNCYLLPPLPPLLPLQPPPFPSSSIPSWGTISYLACYSTACSTTPLARATRQASFLEGLVGYTELLRNLWRITRDL